MRNIVLVGLLVAAAGCSRGPRGGASYTNVTISVPAGATTRAQPTRTLQVGASPDVRVDSPAGTVALRGGDEGAVVVEAVLHGPTEADLDRIRVEVAQEDGDAVRLGWSAEGDRSGLAVAFTVTAPAASRLDVRTRVGSITADGFRGGLLARTGGGTLEATGVTGDLDLETGAGPVEVREGHGAVRVETGGGVIDVVDTTGELRLRSGAGSIDVRGGQGSVHARTGGGVIAVRDRSGDLDVESGAGSVDIVGAAGALRAETGGGTIEIDGRLSGECTVRTGAGSDTMRLPADASLVVDGRTDAGGISTDFPLRVDGKFARKTVDGTLGDGSGGTLHIETGGGSLEVRKR